MAATQKSIKATGPNLKNSQNSMFRPQSPIFSQNCEKLRRILPGFTLSANDMALQHYYYIIHKDESFLSALSTALSVQCGIVDKDGQPKQIITNSRWATNLPPQIILVDQDLEKLSENFILPVQDSGSKFTFFKDSPNSKGIGEESKLKKFADTIRAHVDEIVLNPIAPASKRPEI